MSSNKTEEIDRLRKIKMEMEKRRVDAFPMTLSQLTKLLEEIDMISASVPSESLIGIDNNDIISGGNF